MENPSNDDPDTLGPEGRALLLEACRWNPKAMLSAGALRSNRDFVALAAKANPRCLRHCDPRFLLDGGLLLDCVRDPSRLLRYADTSLRASRPFVLELVSRDGGALQHASEELRADYEVRGARERKKKKSGRSGGGGADARNTAANLQTPRVGSVCFK